MSGFLIKNQNTWLRYFLLRSYQTRAKATPLLRFLDHKQLDTHVHGRTASEQEISLL
jgi:hypothetical protein